MFHTWQETSEIITLPWKILKRARTWLYLFLSGLIGWILTHLLDKVGSGTIRVWDRLLTILSLGSASVRDMPYSSAALNPYPLAPMILLAFLFSMLTVSMVFSTFAFRAVRSAKNWQQSGKPEDNRPSKVQRIMRYYLFISSPFAIICLAALIIQGAVVNQAVLVRRVYEADRDILAPHVTTMQLTELQAQFCSMRGREDFDRLMKQMLQIAKASNVELRPEKL